MLQISPSAKEIAAALGKTGIDAIPYLDLRQEGKREYANQQKYKDFNCGSLNTIKDVEGARLRAKYSRDYRIKVRKVFAQAIKRVKSDIAKMTYGAPLKPDMTKILAALESSQKTHETAIDDDNKAFLNCELKLGKLKKLAK